MKSSDLTEEVFSAVSKNTLAAFTDILKPSPFGSVWTGIAKNYVNNVKPESFADLFVIAFFTLTLSLPIALVFQVGGWIFPISFMFAIGFYLVCQHKVSKWNSRWLQFMRIISEEEYKDIINRLGRYRTRTELKFSECCREENLEIPNVPIDFNFPEEIKIIASENENQRLRGLMLVFGLPEENSSLSGHSEEICYRLRQLRDLTLRTKNDKLEQIEKQRISERFGEIAGAE